MCVCAVSLSYICVNTQVRCKVVTVTIAQVTSFAHHMTVALGVCSCVWASAWCAHMNVEVIATFISCTLSSRKRAATICDCYYINTVLIGSVWYMFKRKGASR